MEERLTSSECKDWSGTVFIGSGWLLYSGPVGRASPHRHHAVQVVVARGGAAKFEDAKGCAHQGAAVQVAADSYHAMPTAVPSAYLLYLESDSAIARRLGFPRGAMRKWVSADLALDAILTEREPESFDSAHTVARRIVEILTLGVELPLPRPRDRSVCRAVDMLPSLIAEFGSALRLPTIAAAVDRAPDRFARAFNAEVGMSVPAYVRWARLRFVARAIARGHTLTDAAHEAGFSDSAHLSRVFRETFGVRPSDLATCTQWSIGDFELN